MATSSSGGSLGRRVTWDIAHENSKRVLFFQEKYTWCSRHPSRGRFLLPRSAWSSYRRHQRLPASHRALRRHTKLGWEGRRSYFLEGFVNEPKEREKKINSKKVDLYLQNDKINCMFFLVTAVLYPLSQTTS